MKGAAAFTGPQAVDVAPEPVFGEGQEFGPEPAPEAPAAEEPQPAAAPEPAKPAEARPSTAARLGAITDTLTLLNTEIDTVGDQVAPLARVVPVQGQLLNALMTAMDAVRADLGMEPIAWEEIVKQAGEGS